MSNGTDCGCGDGNTTTPENQLIVPPGTHIIQQPCAAVPAQSASVGVSALNSGSASSGASGACAGFGMPVVARSFVVAGTNQTGSFFADCAGNWGLPGMIMYFPAQGQLEILGVSQNSVTYRNITVPPGVEILEGVRFAVGIPMAPVVSSGNGSGEGDYESTTQLSNIRGSLNNVPGQIAPIKGNILIGRKGAWQRRQAGQMRYPVEPNEILNRSRSIATVGYTVSLPGKPNLPDEVDNFGVEMVFRVTAAPNDNAGILLSANGMQVAYVAAYDGRRGHDFSSAIITLGKDQGSLNFQTTLSPSGSGSMILRATLLAYHY